MRNEYDLILKKLNDLERRLELYYQLLFIRDDLDLVLKGKYVTSEQMEGIYDGTYTIN